MGNYKIKGFLALVLLCSIANAQKYLNPKEEYDVADGSIYDRFVNITATEKEKEGVMSAIKEIISISPNSTNWKHLAEVIREGKLEENIEEVGGEKILFTQLSIVAYLLENQENSVPTLTRFLESFKKSLYPKNSSEVPDRVAQDFGFLLQPSMFGFDFSVVKSIEKELAEHPEYQASLKSHLEGKGPVSDYFGPLALGGEDRLNALNVYQSFIDAVKNTTDQQQKAFSTFLKEYISMDQSSKITFEDVMTTDMTREKCWGIWRNQSISQKAIEMVKLVNLLDEGFGIKTCLANVIEIKNTDKLSKYWNQHPALGKLTTSFPVDQKFKEILQTMLTDTKDLTRVSTQHLLKTLRLFVNENPKFVGFFETIQQLHGINLEPVWMMMKQFLEFSDENRNNYIKINFEEASLKSLGNFFKAIRNVSNVAKDFEETFMKPNEQWNKEQVENFLELLKVLKKSKYSDEVDRAFDENVSEEECDKILFSGSNMDLFGPLHHLVDSFNSDVLNDLCLKYYSPKIFFPIYD